MIISFNRKTSENFCISQKNDSLLISEQHINKALWSIQTTFDFGISRKPDFLFLNSKDE